MKYRVVSREEDSFGNRVETVEADSFRRTDETYAFFDREGKLVAEVEAVAVLGVFSETKQS